MKCSQQGCNEPAKYSYVWTGPMYACEEHMQAAINIANAMGFPTVERTMQPYRDADNEALGQDGDPGPEDDDYVYPEFQ